MKPKKALLIQFLTDIMVLQIKAENDIKSALPSSEIQVVADTDGVRKVAPVLAPILETQNKIEELLMLMQDE